MRINLNDVARTITAQEGKRISLPIGQVKEVMALTLRWLASLTIGEVITILRRYRKRT